MKNIRLWLIFALILSSICGTSYAEYTLGQPVPLDTRAITPGSTGWFQSNPAIAGSGSVYLAVWVDTRDAGRGSDLYATRIDADGTVLDPLGIRLTTHASVTGKPEVCWNGESFYIVYANNTGVVGTQLLGLRVSPAGVIMDEAPVVIFDTGQPRNPHVSWNGSYHIVAWIGDTESPATYGGVYTRVVSIGGVVADVVRNTCPGATTSDRGASNVAVAAAPDGPILVVWTDERNADVSSTDLYGSVEGVGGGFPISTDTTTQDQPDCCWAGGQFMVVWTDSDETYRSIRGRRVSTDGHLLDPAPLIVSFVTQKQSDPQIAWNGTNCLVTWARRGASLGQFDIYAGRVYSDGTLLDGAGFPVCTAEDRQMKPCVGSLGVNFLVCWMDSRSDVGPTVPSLGFQVRGQRIYSTGLLVGTEFSLTQSAPQHKISCSAYNGRQFLVCFDEWRDGARNLYGELIDAYTGEPVTSEPFLISPLLTENPFPAAAWNGVAFVVTWLGGAEMYPPGYPGPMLIIPRNVMAARVTPAGMVLDPAGIVVHDSGTTPIYTRPAIASDGNRCLITFRTGLNVNGRLLSRDGTVFSSVVVGTSRSNAVYESPAVCWTGQRYLVAWKQALYSGSSGPTPGGIDFRTMTSDGALSTLRRITDTTFPDYFKLACNGDNVLLAAYGPDIRTRRFTLDGTLLDTTPLTIPDSNGADCVSLAWNGNEYVVTWLVGLSDTTSAQGWQDDMQFARINTDNQLVDAGSVAVTETLLSEGGGSTCAGPLGRVFMAYSSFEGAPYQSIRIKGFYMDTLLNLTSLGQIPSLYEGAQISMSGPVATALFADRFYVQESRSFGIGIKSDLTPAPGDAVSFTGKLAKLNGETVLEASEAETVSTMNPIPDPVGMAIRKLGGVGPTSAFSSVDGALGLYNIGLLVRVWGRMGDITPEFFYLDDGSGIVSGPIGNRVKVYGPIPLTIPQPPYVEVTGISGSEQDGGRIVPVIRMTGIRFFGQPPG